MKNTPLGFVNIPKIPKYIVITENNLQFIFLSFRNGIHLFLVRINFADKRRLDEKNM